MGYPYFLLIEIFNNADEHSQIVAFWLAGGRFTTTGSMGDEAALAEAAAGKDSTTGHWESMGVTLKSPLPTYPHGFPQELLTRFEAAIGRGTLGNYPALGKEAAARMPHATLVEFPDLGHAPQIQDPESFHKVLLNSLHASASGNGD